MLPADNQMNISNDNLHYFDSIYVAQYFRFDKGMV